jgi:tRNA threonylcarbamoyl adenosine modification protein (Sua5/YciO/YrdC/YwlC family)
VRTGPDGLAAAVKALARGALVVIPTDTVYGLAADPRVPGAVERLCRAKGRDFRKPIPLLVAGLAEAERAGAVFSRAEKRLALRFWPGALTLVVGIQDAGGATEGIRVPDDPFTLALLRASAGALRVTSANRSGEPPALTAAEAAQSLGACVELVVDAGRLPGGTPSTVARVEGKRVRVLREGVVAAADLERAVQQEDEG